MSIRPATSDDSQNLARLNRVVQQVHFEARPDQFKAPDAGAAHEFFNVQLGRPETVAFLAEDENCRPIGYVLAEEILRPDTPLTRPSAVMYVHHIAIEPSATRSGLGSALMRAVEDEAARRLHDEVRLDFWSFNNSAQEFFAALGYTPFNIRVSRRLKP